jgi:hypothetical protein
MLRAVNSYLYDLLQNDDAKSKTLKEGFKFKNDESSGKFWKVVQTQYKSDRLPPPEISERLQDALQ